MTAGGVPFGTHSECHGVMCRPGQSRLVDRRNIGRDRGAIRSGDGVALDGAVANLRHRVGRLVEQQIDAAGQQILHRRRQPAIRHDLDFCAGLLLEQKARHLIGAAGAAEEHRVEMCSSSHPTSSCILFAGRSFLDTSSSGVCVIHTTGSKSRKTSYCN